MQDGSTDRLGVLVADIAQPEASADLTFRESLNKIIHAHHVVFRSAGGSDAAENLTTLCAAHHQRGIQGGGPLRITGRAAAALRFELALETFASGDLLVVERAVA